MRCPVDKSDMIVVQHQKIELDFCLRCSGVWFDSGELDLLMSALHARGAGKSNIDWLTPREAKTSEIQRKCPICGRKMDKVWLGQESKVLIDRCTVGDGLWFDGGELHQVLHQMKIAGSQDVISFLGDALQGTHTNEYEK